MRLAALERLGGARRIVREHLRVTLNTLSFRERAIAARAFRFLVTPSGAKYAWNVDDLAHAADLPEVQLQPVIDILLRPNVRILRAVPAPPDQPVEVRVEIFHDVLAKEGRDWRQEWVQARERRRVITIAAGVVGLCVLIIIALAVPGVYRAGLRSRAIGLNAMIPLPAGTALLGAADADLRVSGAAGATCGVCHAPARGDERRTIAMCRGAGVPVVAAQPARGDTCGGRDVAGCGRGCVSGG